MEYLHLIITQFNLKSNSLSGNAGYDEWLEWTRNRIRLFRNYCLPSVLNQSCRDFKWLIFFDSGTPEEFSEFLNFLSSFEMIEICYSHGMDDFNENYSKEVRKRIGKTTKWVITTRIDNDDCLHRDAIMYVKDSFVPKHRFLISLASGYVLNIRDKTLSHYFYPMSPFLSLVEDAVKEVEGVFLWGHTKWDNLRLYVFRELWLEYFNRKARNSRFILRKPLWIQTVHGKNISNSFFRGFPVLKEKDLSDFSLNFTTTGLTLKSLPKYCHYVTWKRYMKSLIVKILINK